jgi:hypothetical protein
LSYFPPACAGFATATRINKGNPMADEQKFRFLLEQFKLHTEQLRGFQNERSKITTWSIIAIFAFYGWIFAQQTDDSLAIIAMHLPPVFVFVGWLYVVIIHVIIVRHKNFLDYLENEMFSCGDQTEWNKFKAKGHSQQWLKWMIHAIWGLMFFATLLMLRQLK